MANQLNKFDQLIKESYAGYEAPYNPAHWEELEEELGIAAPGMSSYFGAVTTGLVAVGLVFLTMLFFFADSNSNGKIQNIEVPVVTENGSGQSGANTINLAETNNTDSETIKSESSEVLTSNKTETNKPETAEKANKPANSEKHHNVEPKKPISNNQSITASNEVSTKAKVRKGCTGLIINFDASKEYGQGAKYLWNFGDGYFSNESNPSHTFNKEGVFDVSLSVTSKSTGQISSNVVQAMIEVVEAPVANLNINIDGPNQLKLNNDSYNATSLEWIVNGTTVTDKSDINLSIADNTRYKVALNAMNEGGCTDTLEYAINSISAGSEFPKAMDQTSGHNFAPGAILDSGKVISLKIFNKKTENLVFEGSGNQGWNGTNSHGIAAEKGTYRWVMAVKKSDALDIYNGDIEVR